MGQFEFINLIGEHFGLFISILFLTCVIYYKVFKPLYLFFLDPFLFSQFFSLFATTCVIFLYFTQSISLFFFLQFVLTQIAYWIGLYRFDSKNIRKICFDKKMNNTTINTQQTKTKQTQLLFIYLSFLFIFIQLFVYYKMGIPLFMQSRLALYEGSGGFGFLGKILLVLNVIVSLGCFYIRKNAPLNKPLKFLSNFMLFFVVVVCFLSGSKSTFISLFSLYFLFLLMYDSSKIIKYRKIERYAVLFTFLAALFVISIHNNTESPILLFIKRIVGSGDVFYQGYFLENITKIEGNPINLLFTDILGTYRIVSWNDLPKPIGMQLYSIIYNVDLSMGANARHNYLGLVCFGFFGSIIFSFFLGSILAFIRTKLYPFFYSKGLLYVSFYILLLQGAILMETDFTMFIVRINSMYLTYAFLIIGLLFLFAISFFIGKYSRRLIH